MSIKSSLQKLSLVLLGALVPILTLEFAYRGYERLTLRDWVLTSDRMLGWKLQPGAKRLFEQEEQPYVIQINSAGFRDREHSYTKPAGIFRILVLGDSFVFGSGGVEQSERFTELLERFANHLEVLNMGVPGYSLDQEYLDLKTKGLSYQPDLVILCLFENDFQETFVTFNPSIGRPKGDVSIRNGGLLFRPPSLPLSYVLSHQSRVFSVAQLGFGKLARRLTRHQQSRRVPEVAQIDPQTAIRAFKLLLVGAKELAQKAGADFLLVYLPPKGQERRNIIQEAMSDLERSQGLKTLDLMEYLRQVDAENSLYFKIDAHLNRHGHQVVARALYEFLATNGLLTSSGPAEQKASH